MIPTNLKVGETFKEGERTYEVIEVNADGSYISKAVEATEEPIKRRRRKEVEE